MKSLMPKTLQNSLFLGEINYYFTTFATLVLFIVDVYVKMLL